MFVLTSLWGVLLWTTCPCLWNSTRSFSRIFVGYQGGRPTLIRWDFSTFGVIPICSNFQVCLRWFNKQREVTVSGVYAKTGYLWLILRCNRSNSTHSDGKGVFLHLLRFCCCWSFLLTLCFFHKVFIIFNWHPLLSVSLLLSFSGFNFSVIFLCWESFIFLSLFILACNEIIDDISYLVFIINIVLR